MWRAFALVTGLAATAAAQPAVTPAQDPAWAAYDAAFARAEAGQSDEAQVQLRAVVAAFPGHPAALRAAELVARFEPKPDDPNAPSKLARGELIFWSTLGGVSIGVNVCQIASCDTDRSTAAVFMATTGGSLAASVLLTRKGVREGQAQLYNAAQTWGAWNGLAINDGFAETRAEAATALGMHAAGLATGLVLWETWRPSQGDVALTNTAWVWGAVLSTFGHLAVSPETITFRRIVLASDVALVAGMLASTQIEVSRGRTLLIDVGGVLGLLGGALVAIGTDSEEAASTAMLIGTSVGLGAGVVLSSDWDAPSVPVSPAPVAGPQSTGIGLASAFSF